MTDSLTWMCVRCGWIYGESKGSPECGIAPNTPWDRIPARWDSPEWGAGKDDFEMVRI
ncbi:MAG TPA: rubredoxin [Comamonadaceae bacterium]|nr:rubredoxin [Comamonadaceae bacterium]